MASAGGPLIVQSTEDGCTGTEAGSAICAGGDSLESPLIVSSQILCVLAVARVRGRELVFGCVVSGVEEIACF